MERDVTPRPASSDVGVGELVRRLADDSKRLAADEVRLAKLEVSEGLRDGARGAMWLGVASGIAVVATVALTIFIASAIGAIAGGRYWMGALLVGVVEVAVGALLVRRGVGTYHGIDFSLATSRETLRDSAAWARAEGRTARDELARQPSRVRAELHNGLAEAARRPPRAD